jgi:hypothetical protein
LINTVAEPHHSNKPSIGGRSRSGRRNLPEHDEIHIQFHRKGLLALHPAPELSSPKSQEKQAENIVEKLCQRFHLTEDARQWRDIAFCLSLLPFKSERSVKKLIEGLQFYRDKLHEETVFARFQDILAKARANKSANKPETELNEFESVRYSSVVTLRCSWRSTQILEQHKLQGQDDQALEQRVGKKKAAAKKRATKRSAYQFTARTGLQLKLLVAAVSSRKKKQPTPARDDLYASE